jgi:regulator of cell morphogenesis and NO signaling
MNITEESIIGDVVAADYRAAGVFSNYKIDFCCNGNRSLSTAAKEAEVNLESLIYSLGTLNKDTTESNNNYSNWSLDFLADYIYHNHHTYVEEKLPVIKQYLDKVTTVHGKEHPELFEVQKLFNDGAYDLVMHMKKEELVLFPFIKKMIHAEKENIALETPPFGTVENPIDMMQEEHNNEGERYRKISKLTNNYQVPSGACNSYQVLYKMLEEFEKDLHLHIHLESNILFKKALKLEQELKTLN